VVTLSIRHQRNPLESGPFGNIDHRGNLPKLQVLIAAHEHNCVAANLVDLPQAFV
jgi:hypothetical protein